MGCHGHRHTPGQQRSITAATASLPHLQPTPANVAQVATRHSLARHRQPIPSLADGPDGRRCRQLLPHRKTCRQQYCVRLVNHLAANPGGHPVELPHSLTIRHLRRSTTRLEMGFVAAGHPDGWLCPARVLGRNADDRVPWRRGLPGLVSTLRLGRHTIQQRLGGIPDTPAPCSAAHYLPGLPHPGLPESPIPCRYAADSVTGLHAHRSCQGAFRAPCGVVAWLPQRPAAGDYPAGRRVSFCHWRIGSGGSCFFAARYGEAHPGRLAGQRLSGSICRSDADCPADANGVFALGSVVCTC